MENINCTLDGESYLKKLSIKIVKTNKKIFNKCSCCEYCCHMGPVTCESDRDSLRLVFSALSEVMRPRNTSSWRVRASFSCRARRVVECISVWAARRRSSVILVTLASSSARWAAASTSDARSRKLTCGKEKTTEINCCFFLLFGSPPHRRSVHHPATAFLYHHRLVGLMS